LLELLDSEVGLGDLCDLVADGYLEFADLLVFGEELLVGFLELLQVVSVGCGEGFDLLVELGELVGQFLCF